MHEVDKSLSKKLSMLVFSNLIPSRKLSGLKDEVAENQDSL
jgi:hypothetical protein